MGRSIMHLAILVLYFTLICTIVCDNNVTNIETTTQSVLSSTSQSTSTIITSSPSTTTISTITSTAPSSENATKSVQFPSNWTQFLNTTSYVCSCDITFDCDINCCCDLDCNAEIVEAFDCSIGVEIDDYYHGEGLERCGVSSGLLCITHDNVPSIDQKLLMPYHAEYSSYKWPKTIQFSALEHHHELSSHDFYKYGDAIMTYDTRSEKYQTIDVPALTIGDSSSCFLTEPVMFLKSKSIQCLRSYNELCSYNNNLMSQLMHTRLFHRPPKSTSSLEMSDIFNIVIESCKHTFDNCTQISSINVGDRSSISKNNNIVEEMQEFIYDDVFEDIQLTFHINDTKMLSATIKFGCHNELICNNSDELETTKIIQNIQIKFINVNENRKERRIRKKQRGYNDDEIIIASRYRPLNESITAPSSNTEMIFDYFRNDTMETKSYSMKLPETTENGKCVMDDGQYDVVRFNENIQTLCSAELTRDINSNFTICQQFQHQLMNFLFNTLNLTSNYTLDDYTSDVYVSKFWTPRYDPKTWIRTSFYNMPLWSPEMQESEKIVTCTNLVASVNYKFLYYSVKSSGSRKYENFIQNLIVEFGKLDQLQFPLDDENQTTQNVKIQINVQFINLFLKNHANSMMNTYTMVLCILLASLASLPFMSI